MLGALIGDVRRRSPDAHPSSPDRPRRSPSRSPSSLRAPMTDRGASRTRTRSRPSTVKTVKRARTRRTRPSARATRAAHAPHAQALPPRTAWDRSVRARTCVAMRSCAPRTSASAHAFRSVLALLPRALRDGPSRSLRVSRSSQLPPPAVHGDRSLSQAHGIAARRSPTRRPALTDSRFAPTMSSLPHEPTLSNRSCRRGAGSFRPESLGPLRRIARARRRAPPSVRVLRERVARNALSPRGRAR